MTADNLFEPQILAFCCKYCAYAAGDLAGSMRLTYPAAEAAGRGRHRTRASPNVQSQLGHGAALCRNRDGYDRNHSPARSVARPAQRSNCFITTTL